MYSVNDYIANPTHDIKVALVGVGGTGSFVLPELVALSETMKMLGRKGLEIFVYDDDKVESHNVGRQKFFPCDVGEYKSEVLVNRVNRAYGSQVKYFTEKFDMKNCLEISPNIIISCVDSVKSRKTILDSINNNNGGSYCSRYDTMMYWIDCGNSRDYGQVILGAVPYENGDNKKENNKIRKEQYLPNIFELHPNMEDKPDEPSCSLRASLSEQSFMINKMTGVYAMELLSSLLLDYNTKQSEIYFSLNPINVKCNKL